MDSNGNISWSQGGIIIQIVNGVFYVKEKDWQGNISTKAKWDLNGLQFYDSHGDIKSQILEGSVKTSSLEASSLEVKLTNNLGGRISIIAGNIYGIRIYGEDVINIESDDITITANDEVAINADEIYLNGTTRIQDGVTRTFQYKNEDGNTSWIEFRNGVLIDWG
jgi:hypothetical protein